MSTQGEYNPPLVDAEDTFWPSKKKVKGMWEVLLHGLKPHKAAKEPQKLFSSTHISDGEDFLETICLEFYKETAQRIDGLEEKGFKLLTYISAISAISIYFMSTEITGVFKAIVILSILFHVLAIIISLRCISIKSQKALFIDGIFKFDPNNEPKTKNKKEMIANLVNCAVFNQGVADNTADLIKACRFMLSVGIWLTAISCIFLFSHSNDEDKTYQVKLSDSTEIRAIAADFRQLKNSSIKISGSIKVLKREVDSLKILQIPRTPIVTSPKK